MVSPSLPTCLPLIAASAETVLAAMRNPDHCLYGFAKSKRERSAEDAETAFNQLSLQVRLSLREAERSVGSVAHDTHSRSLTAIDAG